MKYRPEIDGLRSLAVVPVILFHAGIPGFSGGFVGVDIFFVISGFLITTLLLDDLSRGDFSLLRFYDRRARRILPALFVVMAVCLPLAWAWMLPNAFDDFAKSLIAVSLFASNILFWRQDNYFAPTAEEKPLLHTWSLSVEEQFYLLFPLALMALWPLGRRRIGMVILCATIASYGLMDWAMRDPRVTPTAVFYLLPTRAWELLSGAFCACLIHRRGVVAHELLAGLGLALLLLAFMVIGRSTIFPSAWTLLPVIGTCLILTFATPQTATGWLLSRRGLVGLGLISYSTYLWHQPLLAFARIRSLTDPSPHLMLALSVLSVGLGWLSWRFIERPFRQSTPWPRRPALFAASLAGLAGFALIGAGLTSLHGAPGRIPPAALAYLTSHPTDQTRTTCEVSGAGPVDVHPRNGCLIPSQTGNKTTPPVIVMGDSHAGTMLHALSQRLTAMGENIYLSAATGCVPLPGFIRQDLMTPNCEAHVGAVLTYARKSGARDLILVARLPYYLHHQDFDNGMGVREKGGPVFVDVIDAPNGSDAERRARVLDGYRNALIDLSAEFRLTLVRPIPPAGWHVPHQLARREMFGANLATLSIPRQVVEDWRAPITALLDELEAQGVIRTVDPMTVLCPDNGPCLHEADGRLLYADDDHLSPAGADLVAKQLQRLMTQPPHRLALQN